MDKFQESQISVMHNPSDLQRHEMLRNTLTKLDRDEDYNNIIKILSPPPDITSYAAPGQYKNIKVAVVGAGIAGLTAAFELRKLGFDITIFEADKERIGGRVYTYYFDRAGKLYGEFGAMRIPVSHETSWHYINLFKLKTHKFIQSSPNSFIYVRNIRTRNNPKEIKDKIYPLFNMSSSEKNIPWPEIYNRVIRSALKSLNPELRSVLINILPLKQYPPEFFSVAAITIRQALEQSGLSGAAISLITSLIPTVNAFINGALGEELSVEYSASFSDLYSIDDGMANLPYAFYKSLTSQNPQEYNIPCNALGKITFKMGNSVTELCGFNSDGKIILKYLTESEPKGTYEAFDYIFLAVPLAALRKMNFNPVFSDLFMEAIREVFYIDAQKTLFLCRERFWEKQGIIGGSSHTDLLIQSIVYPSDQPFCRKSISGKSLNCSANLPGVLTASYNLGNDAIRLGNYKSFRFQLIKRQLEAVHGLPHNFLDYVVTDYKTVDWYRNEWISGGFVNFFPGQGRFYFEMLKPEYNNRVFLAGEAYFPPHGWIQSALYTGMLAADALAFYLRNIAP